MGFAGIIHLDADGAGAGVLKLRLPALTRVPPPVFRLNRPPKPMSLKAIGRAALGKNLANAFAKIAGLGKFTPHAIAVRLIQKAVTAFVASALQINTPEVAALTTAIANLTASLAIGAEKAIESDAAGDALSTARSLERRLVTPVMDAVESLARVAGAMVVRGANEQLVRAAAAILNDRLSSPFLRGIVSALPGGPIMAGFLAMASGLGTGITISDPMAAIEATIQARREGLIQDEDTRAEAVREQQAGGKSGMGVVGQSNKPFDFAARQRTDFGLSAIMARDREELAAGIAALVPLRERLTAALDKFGNDNSWRVLASGGDLFVVLGRGLDQAAKRASQAVAAFGQFRGTLPARVAGLQRGIGSFNDALQMDFQAAQALAANASGRQQIALEFGIIAFDAGIRLGIALTKAITETIAGNAPAAALHYAAAAGYVATLTLVGVGLAGGIGSVDDVPDPERRARAAYGVREAMLVVNAPGYTNVDQLAEEIAQAINADGTVRGDRVMATQNFGEATGLTGRDFVRGFANALERQFLDAPDKEFVVTSLPALTSTAADIVSDAYDSIEDTARDTWEDVEDFFGF